MAEDEIVFGARGGLNPEAELVAGNVQVGIGEDLGALTGRTHTNAGQTLGERRAAGKAVLESTTLAATPIGIDVIWRKSATRRALSRAQLPSSSGRLGRHAT